VKLLEVSFDDSMMVYFKNNYKYLIIKAYITY
jgi:hypothetical protein